MVRGRGGLINSELARFWPRGATGNRDQGGERSGRMVA